MPLDEAAAWKFNYLLKCAAAGMTPEETHAQVRRQIKQADGPDYAKMVRDGITTAQTAFSPIKGMAMGALHGVTDYALPVAGLGPAGVGGGLGLLAAKMQDDDVDPHEVRKQELINTYRHYTEQLEARKRMAARGLLG